MAGLMLSLIATGTYPLNHPRGQNVEQKVVLQQHSEVPQAMLHGKALRVGANKASIVNSLFKEWQND